jgi:hypothetical protein
MTGRQVEINIRIMRCEVLTAVLVKIKVFRDVRLCHLAWFGGVYYPHLQGLAVYAAYEIGYILRFHYSKLELPSRK